MVESLPNMKEALGSIFSLNLAVVVHAYPSARGVDAGGSQVWTPPFLHSDFEARLGYMRSYLFVLCGFRSLLMDACTKGEI